MYEFNVKQTPTPFGLRNTGVLCYFNSLCQCLMSCSSFNMNIQTGSEIGRLYTNMLNQRGSSYDVAAAINRTRKSQKLKWNISPNNQEDIHEGFILMMEALDNEYNDLFKIRYKSRTLCGVCGYESRNNNDPELYLSCPALTSQTEYENYINMRYEFPKDYVCEECGASNQAGNNIIYQEVLCRLSSVIIILFTENQQRLIEKKQKKTVWFPEKLSFNGMDRTLNYEVVAQAEQYGTLSSGHYTATCRRDGVYTFNVFYHLVAG